MNAGCARRFSGVVDADLTTAMCVALGAGVFPLPDLGMTQTVRDADRMNGIDRIFGTYPDCLAQ